ncbi:hypothetical protein [Hydromonas duriensis]|uniref:Terminase family protein n=1 Tax=Hydromonas duriensis TaxID=1527608 RepID=A0A4V3DJM9_9BURK|nr:hypothetical protein [Hydromonas duriensis]TDR30669.1 hypothetical protein DFR44_11816 [Hydromonas duriensis]
MPPNLLNDPRYERFVDLFQNDPLAFVMGVCTSLVSDDQRELLEAIKPNTAKVSVVSGTGTGKTNMYGRIALWHMLCFPVAYYDGKYEIGSNTYIGAAKVEQVAEGVWKEMNDALLQIKQGEFAWIVDYIQAQTDSFYIKGYKTQWFIHKFAMQKGSAVSIAGKHRYWQLIIVDEAAGVADEHYDVINGTQTQGGNRTLLASQGARNAGFFYNTHHNLSITNGGNWHDLRFSSENSPFVTLEWLKNVEFESGGKDSVEYRVRVLAQFAENEHDNLLTRAALESCFKQSSPIHASEAWGWLLLVDVGMGEYRDDSVCVLAKVCGDEDFGDNARRVEYVGIPICTNSKDMTDFRGLVSEVYNSVSNATIVVDAGGAGAEFAKLLERDGKNVKRVNWGNPCFKKAYKNRYFNLRACAMVRFRDAVRQGRVSITPNLERILKNKMLLQGSRLPYSFTEEGVLRYKMMGKNEMRAKGIKSPDIIDAMSFVFLEDVFYNVSDAALDDGEQGVVAQDYLEQAKALFADVE